MPQTVGAASSVSFRSDGAQREAGAVPVPPVRGDRRRRGTIEAAARLQAGPPDIEAVPRGSSNPWVSRGTSDFDFGDWDPDTTQPGLGSDEPRRCAERRWRAALLALGARSSSPRWVGGECVKSAAFFPICRRLCIGVAHRGRHASGLEHLCTTRPSGFRASLSSPSWVMVSRGHHASGLEHLCTTRPSGFSASISSPFWIVVSCGLCASGLEHLCTTRPSGSTARCGRRASGFGQRCTTRPSGFAPPEHGASAGPTFLNTPVDRRYLLDTIGHSEAGCA